LFHFEVHLSIEMPGASPLALCVLISLPPRYPTEHAPIVQLRGDLISGAALRALHAALVQFVQLECEGTFVSIQKHAFRQYKDLMSTYPDSCTAQVRPAASSCWIGFESTRVRT
jgi:hypothetical protein